MRSARTCGARCAGSHAQWAFRVQLCRDLGRQPIADPTVEWDGADAPFHTVGTLRVATQDSRDPVQVRLVDEETRLAVWTGIAAHQPAGNINRARNEPQGSNMTQARPDDSRTARILRGVLTGIVAGAVASLAMDRFQAAAAALTPSDTDDDRPEPATQQAADAIARRVAGTDVPDRNKPLAGQSVHYAPWKSDVGTALYGYASHLVFGGTAELVRRQVRATLIAR